MNETKNDIAIALNNVTFAYSTTPVVKQATFAIQNGDFVGIVGKNGSGKSTLLKLILGQLKPQTGVVFLNPSLKLGYVEQVTPNSDYAFPASVLEIVTLGLYEEIGMFRFAKAKHKKLALHALHMVGLEGFEHRQFSMLSGGQQQRVIIAKALASNPDLLILDEPTTGIDANSEKEFVHLLRHLNLGHGKTIVMVTHNTDRLKTANKVLTVEDGLVKEHSHVAI